MSAAAEAACSAPLAFHPGEGWEYGINNDILGRVIEVASGMPLQDFMQQRLFAPLGMTDTGFYVPDDKLARFTAQYEGGGSSGLRRLQGPEQSPWRDPRRAPSGNSGMVGTAGDYLRFLLMLANNGELDGVRILHRETIDQMARNYVPAGAQTPLWAGLGPGRGYGLGFGVDTNVAQAGAAGSDGTIFWAGSEQLYFWVDRRERIAGLWMTQAYIAQPAPYVDNYLFDIMNRARELTYAALVE